MTRYIIDIATNRVVFFTEDDSIKLTVGDSTILYEDEFPLPEGLTLGNAWSWKLRGRTLVKDESPESAPTSTPDTLTVNKNNVKELLIRLINGARRDIQPKLTLEFYTVQLLYAEITSESGPWPICESISKATKIPLETIKSTQKERYDAIHKKLISTEQWYQYYLAKIDQCVNLDELAFLRDEIGARNFNLDLF